MPAVMASPMLKTFGLECFQEAESSVGFDALVNEFNLWSTPASGSNTTYTSLQDLRLLGTPVNHVHTSLAVGRVFQNLRHLTLQDPSRSTNIAWAEIWDTLYEGGCKDNLWLETLHTEGVQSSDGIDALLKYLSSHPGLKALTIRGPPYDKGLPYGFFDEDLVIEGPGVGATADFIDAENEKNLQRATTFWDEIIPRFGWSLRELTVNPSSSSPWDYGPSASKALRQCKVLRKLGITCSYVDPNWASEKATQFKMKKIPRAPDADVGASRSDNCELVCRTAGGSSSEDEEGNPKIPWGRMSSIPVLLASDLGDMPFLEEVQITLAVEDSSWGACGTDILELLKNNRAQAFKALERFVPWEGYPHKLYGEDGIIFILDGFVCGRQQMRDDSMKS